MDVSKNIIAIIQYEANANGINDTELIKDIINPTTWWRIKQGKSHLGLHHALQLMDRLNIKFKIYIPERILVSSDANNSKKQ